MKHRWIAIAALTAALALGGCQPADSGADETPGTAPSSTPTAEPNGATPTPYVIDEY